MANILPLLALAGGAAYLISKKKKSECPKQIIVDEAKVAADFQKATTEVMQDLAANNGDIDPTAAADKIFSVFAPLQCKNSNTVIIAGDKKAVASEFHKSLVAAFEIGENIADIFDNLKGAAGGVCPTLITKDYAFIKDAALGMMQVATKNDDPVEFSNKIFAIMAPIDCKWNKDTMIELSGLGAFPAPQIYGAVLADVLEKFVDKGFINPGDATKFFTEFRDKYTATTGEVWADPIGQ